MPLTLHKNQIVPIHIYQIQIDINIFYAYENVFIFYAFHLIRFEMMNLNGSKTVHNFTYTSRLYPATIANDII